MAPTAEHHMFNIEIACEVGIEKAVLLQNISFWLNKNVANSENVHDGVCWTYNSAHAFNLLFPYIPERSIARLLKELEDEGWLVSRNDLNSSKFDKKKWYSWGLKLEPLILADRSYKEHIEAISLVSQNGRSIGQTDQSASQNDRTIADINTNITTDNKLTTREPKNTESVELVKKDESKLDVEIPIVSLSAAPEISEFAGVAASAGCITRWQDHQDDVIRAIGTWGGDLIKSELLDYCRWFKDQGHTLVKWEVFKKNRLETKPTLQEKELVAMSEVEAQRIATEKALNKYPRISDIYPSSL